jgi:uncharacterized protein
MRAARLAIFLSIVLFINLLLHGYLWLRLVRSPGWPAPWGRIGTAVLVGLALLFSASLYFMRVAPRSVGTVLAWIGFIWLGLVFLFFLLLLATEPLRPLLRLVLAMGGAGLRGATGIAVGRIVARAVAVFVLAGGTMLGVAAVISARVPAGVRTIPVSLDRWPAPLSGYTVVQISDLHVGETVGKGFVESVVQRVNAQDPDLIVITGDLVDGTVEHLGPLVAPLESLRARDGVWFVTGNHEYYSGAAAWVEHLRALGIRVLCNERAAIGGDSGFDLAGTNDYAAGYHGPGPGQGEGPGRGQGAAAAQDIPRALAGRDPARPVILLAHQPRSFVEAAALGVDLQLSGHTHGGQVYPIHYASGRVQGFLAGLYKRGDSWLYVSRGTGYWGPPMRLGAPPEITRIVISSRSPATGLNPGPRRAAPSSRGASTPRA